MNSFDFELWIEQYNVIIKKTGERALFPDEMTRLDNNIDDYGQYNKFALGNEFVISENDTVLGVVNSEPIYAGNIDGFFVTFKTTGSYNYKNGFMLNGNMYLAPGMILNIYGEDSTHKAEIYSIEIIR